MSGEGSLVPDEIMNYDASGKIDAAIKEWEQANGSSEEESTTPSTDTTSTASGGSFDYSSVQSGGGSFDFTTNSTPNQLLGETSLKYDTYYPHSMYGYGSNAGYGNYNPKIYSNSRSVSADRASTMYSKQPRDANYSYLRPSFETKGSRSAYER